MINPDLIVLIRLLKAEGVTEYQSNGIILKIGGELPCSTCAGRSEVDRREAEVQAEAQTQAYSDSETEVEIPPKLRGLNPNYFKLSRMAKR